MPEFNLKTRSINMGDEDSWDLVVSDDLGSACVTHWWSRRSGGITSFNNDSVEISLEDFKRSDPDLFLEAADKLRGINFKGTIP